MNIEYVTTFFQVLLIISICVVLIMNNSLLKVYMCATITALNTVVCILSFVQKDYVYGFLYVVGALIWLDLWVLENYIYTESLTKGRGFEFVSSRKHPTEALRQLPTRADVGSAGYDFYAPMTFICNPHEVTKIWTDVKAYMEQDEVLLLDVRSSMGGRFHLANTIGIIDSSYYNNTSNEGNIGFFLVNDTNEPIIIKKGERIGQGIFTTYLTTNDDSPLSSTRNGGFGSSGK